MAISLHVLDVWLQRANRLSFLRFDISFAERAVHKNVTILFRGLKMATNAIDLLML